MQYDLLLIEVYKHEYHANFHFLKIVLVCMHIISCLFKWRNFIENLPYSKYLLLYAS